MHQTYCTCFIVSASEVLGYRTPSTNLLGENISCQRLSNFGSKSLTVRPAQEKSEMLPKHLDKLLERPHGFDPRTEKRSEKGSIATVQMNTLSTGRKLFFWLEVFKTG